MSDDNAFASNDDRDVLVFDSCSCALECITHGFSVLSLHDRIEALENRVFELELARPVPSPFPRPCGSFISVLSQFFDSIHRSDVWV